MYRKVALSNETASILIAACDGISDDSHEISLLAEHLGIAVKHLTNSITTLRQMSFLCESHDNDASIWRDFFTRWRTAGWVEASCYQAATFDYRFADYRNGGHGIDLKRMEDYAMEGEGDVDRVKRTPGAVIADSVGLPADTRLNAPCRALVGEPVPPTSLDRSSLFDVLAMVFVATRRVELVSPGASPAIIRTSPSGGARHPSEGYLYVKLMKGLAPGLYHVVSDNGDLELLECDEDIISELFHGVSERCPFEPSVIVIITTVVGRNMYRYREPRTFRTIHMDAGHIVGSLLAFSTARGLAAHADGAFDIQGFESAIRTDPFSETALVTVALGGGIGATE